MSDFYLPPSPKLILAATDQFNKKPKQGIAFLLEQNILTSPLDSAEVADFLLENPALSKARIGDYVGDRKNVEILETFVRYVGMSMLGVGRECGYFCEVDRRWKSSITGGRCFYVEILE